MRFEEDSSVRVETNLLSRSMPCSYLVSIEEQPIMIRITCLSLFMLVCGSITAQQPAAPVSPSQNPQRPTLTNEDLRLQGAADFAARQNVTGQELLSGLEKTQSFRMHCIVSDGEHLDLTVEVVPP